MALDKKDIQMINNGEPVILRPVGRKNIPTFKFALREDLEGMKQFMPTRGTSKSSGWDVACAFENHQDYTVQPGEYVKIPLGLRCIPEEGFWFEMKPRSSSFTKKKLHALYGTVDSDYRQQLYFCAKYDGTEPLTLKFGERIGQIIPVKIQEMTVEEISNQNFDQISQEETNDRISGFGSTDLKIIDLFGMPENNG